MSDQSRAEYNKVDGQMKFKITMLRQSLGDCKDEK